MSDLNEPAWICAVHAASVAEAQHSNLAAERRAEYGRLTARGATLEQSKAAEDNAAEAIADKDVRAVMLIAKQLYTATLEGP
jgi:hypothetical protein